MNIVKTSSTVFHFACILNSEFIGVGCIANGYHRPGNVLLATCIVRYILALAN